MLMYDLNMVLKIESINILLQSKDIDFPCTLSDSLTMEMYDKIKSNLYVIFEQIISQYSVVMAVILNFVY